MGCGTVRGILLEALLHRRVPVVLDGVVAAAGQVLGDLGPAVAHAGVQLVEELVLLLGPRRLLDLGVEVVVPALAALFACCLVGVKCKVVFIIIIQ